MENVLECAFIVLWLQLGWLSGEDQVEQSPRTLRLQEGNSVSLNCSYTVSSFRGLQWFRQDPGKGPELLFLLYSVNEEKQKERLKATLLKKGSSLHITASKPEDSATYLCAVETQCSRAHAACTITPQLRSGHQQHLCCSSSSKKYLLSTHSLAKWSSGERSPVT
uniref:T cell receptor alpha variable 20 n=1 Tax=Suricata suricatta TaxID=37032 RepID=A0A673T9W5_SURSU